MLGSYEPHMKQVVLKKERILHWLGQGAQASDSVHNLLVKEGVVTESKRAIKMEKPAVKEEPAPEAPAAEETVAKEVAEAPKEETAEVAEAPAEAVAEEKAA